MNPEITAAPPPPAPPRGKETTFMGDFRRFFIHGLAVLLPSVLTLWLLWQAYVFLDRQVGEPINRGVRSSILWVLPRLVSDTNLPPWFGVSVEDITDYRMDLERAGPEGRQQLRRMTDSQLRHEVRARKFKDYWDSHWYFRLIGLFVAITLIYLAGRLLRGYIGRRIYLQAERLITRVPVIKQVYPHVKQVVEMIFGEKQVAFRRVVLVEYPRKGLWTLGFVTNDGMAAVQDCAGEHVLSVFIPSTPTPFTGFVISVPRSAAIDMPLSIDEAIRFVLTGGVLVPPRQRTSVATIESAPAESA